MRSSLSIAALAAVSLHAAPAAAGPKATWFQLPTGNGLGFQVYDVGQANITTFLDHPYAYTGPRPDPMAEGFPRRNLGHDLYFGLRAPGGAGWLPGTAAVGAVEYDSDTNLIHAPFTFGPVTGDTWYFSPFGFEENMMVAVVHAPGASDAYLLMNFHLGATVTGTQGESLAAIAAQQAVAETGPGGGAMVYVPLSGVDHADCQGVYAKVQAGQDLGDKQDCAGDDVVPAFQKALGADGWWAVGVGFTEDAADAAGLAQRIAAWSSARPPAQLLADARSEWDTWRKPSPAGGQHENLWRQSEAVLRMAQVREPITATRKNHGMLLASLAPGAWSSAWVRDAAFSVAALARSGHLKEARLGLDFFLNASPVGKYKSYVHDQDYRVSVGLYYGNGEEVAEYAGQATPNVALDGWGMVLWAARRYMDASGDLPWLDAATQHGDTVYEALLNGIARPLEANLEPSGIVVPDTTHWGVHTANSVHSAFSTMAAIRGFCDLAAIARKAGHDADADHYKALSASMKAAFPGVFTGSQGALCSSVEGMSQPAGCNHISLAAAFTWDILDSPQSPLATATLAQLQTLETSTGGYRADDGALSSYDQDEWVLGDLLMSDALRRAGHEAEAEALLQHRIVDVAAVNRNLLPELYDAVNGTGDYAGSVPMVGYGAALYMSTLLDRAGLLEATDCDGVGGSGGGAGGSGGGGSGTGGAGTGTGGGTGGVPGSHTTACSCQIGDGGEGTWHLLPLAAALLLLRRRPRR